jgi:hypothetical protein
MVNCCPSSESLLESWNCPLLKINKKHLCCPVDKVTHFQTQPSSSAVQKVPDKSSLVYLAKKHEQQLHPLNPIDYRQDDAKKKVSSWGDILVSLRSWRLQDSKNAGHWPSPSIHSSANSKKLPCMDCQVPTPTSQNSPFLVK